MRISTSSISLLISVLALLVSLLGLAPHVKLVADTVYALSVWTGDKQSGVTLRYLGVIPVASCYIAGSSIEQMKKMCVGSRYNG